MTRGRPPDSASAPGAEQQQEQQRPRREEQSEEEQCLIRLRLSHIDYVLSPDSSDSAHLDVRTSPLHHTTSSSSSRLSQVPVIRIFGATDGGQRAVAHVHGAFPYIYVEYHGSLDPDELNKYMLVLAKSLDLALATTAKSKPGGHHQQQRRQHVAFIVPCKGTNFYGYHVGWQVYLKIYLVDPRRKKAASEALRSGAILSRRFQVYEDHIPFILQFLLDCNLFGCGWVYIAKDRSTRFRRPLPERAPGDSAPNEDSLANLLASPPAITGAFNRRSYTLATVPERYWHALDSGPEKVSFCALELDCSVAGIRNRHAVLARALHHDFVEYSNATAAAARNSSRSGGGAGTRDKSNTNEPATRSVERLVTSVDELWQDERARRKLHGDKGPSAISDSAPRDWDTRDARAPVWSSEPVLRQVLETKALKDARDFRERHEHFPNFGSFVRDAALDSRKGGDAPSRLAWLGHIRTAFEQVDAIFPRRMAQDELARYPFGAWAVRGIGIDHEPFADLDGSQRRAASSPAKAARQQRSASSDVDIDLAKWRSTQRELIQARAPANGGGGDAEEEDEDDPWALGGDGDEDDDDLSEDQDEPDELELEPETTLDTPDPVGLAAPDMSKSVSAQSNASRKHSAQPAPPPAAAAAPPPAAAAAPKAVSAALDFDFGESGMPPPPPAKRRKLDASSSPAAKSPARALAPTTTTTTTTTGLSLLSPRPAPPPSPDNKPKHMSPSVSRRESPQESTPVKPQPALEDELADLPSEIFDDCHPTPTQIVAAPSILPPELVGDSALTGLVSNGTELSPSRRSSTPSSLSPPSPGDGDAAEKDGEDDEDNNSKSASIPSIRLTASAEQAPLTTTDSSARSLLHQPLSSNSSLERERLKSKTLSAVAFEYAAPPPTKAQLLETFVGSRVQYADPFFSNPSDIGRTFSFGGRTHKQRGTRPSDYGPFEHHPPLKEATPRRTLVSRGIRLWERARPPPTRAEVARFVAREKKNAQEKETAARDGGAAKNKKKDGQHEDRGDPGREKQHLDCLAVELHIETRDDFLPDPLKDRVVAVFYSLLSETDGIEYNGRLEGTHIGVICVGDAEVKKRLGSTRFVLDVVSDEEALVDLFVHKVREWDPEIFVGYQLQRLSLGYLVERAREVLERDLIRELGRVSRDSTGKFGSAKDDRWQYRQSTTLNFTGRHCLPIWRIFRSDFKLTRYTLEHVVQNVLQQRVPHYSTSTLTSWGKSDRASDLRRLLDYYMSRTELDIELIEQAEVIPQTSEFARVFGIDFNSVRVRGSQFKVESVMLRIAKPESLLLLSPNRAQVGKQNAAECQPLIMEPQSAFYKGPVLVLDFQSLYPSVMCAYNLCYSTCLGRVTDYKGTAKLGVTNLDLPTGALALLKDHITISPNGIAFVKPHIRKSLLAKMLTELLDTRVMVKESMKLAKKDKNLLRVMNARQLSLKFLANVTYGYTSATYSGRMPCVEVADTIVQCGRETLERALRTINGTKQWGAEVVYGDTDSLFVFLPGRSKDDAFRIGHEIANTITSQNPRPIKLKFEKVYLPSVLLAKKRYVGYMYETEDVVKPDFDAKGIETVRRDGIPALQRILEDCLRIIFQTSDLSKVKAYLEGEWTKMMRGEVSPYEFTYAKEVKMGSYTSKVPPPGAMIAGRQMEIDPRSEPEYGDRVPYVILQAPPGTRQIDKAVSPEMLVKNPKLRIDAIHYIERAIIPPLSRVFNLMGADIESWWRNMHKVSKGHAIFATAKAGDPSKGLMTDYYASTACVGCGANRAAPSRALDQSSQPLCEDCLADLETTVYSVSARSQHALQRASAARRTCASCSGSATHDEPRCTNVDCPILYERVAADAHATEADELLKLVSAL